jgi:hypothetical protein
MGETLDFWLSGRTWTDWQQGKRMDEIESAQAAQAASLSRTVRNQTTALDARVSRLEDALAAFVELEDTRSTLNEFADAAAARRFARDLAQQLLGADAPSAPPAPPNDLPGYWLTPAVKAVIADVFPGTGDAAALTAEARRRDDESADLFALLVDALRGRAADAGDRVDRWMPTGEAIDRTQRAVCDAVASGRFGELSRTRLIDRLRSLVPPPDATGDERAAHLAAALGIGAVAGSPDQAADQLDDLRRLVAAPTSEADAGANAAIAFRDDPLAELLAVVINEGAPGESPVLQRMSSIRQSLAAVGVPGAPPLQSSRDDAGDVWRFLAESLREGASAPRRELAQAVLAPWLRARADRLLEVASAAADASVSITVAGRPVVVGATGPVEDGWAPPAVDSGGSTRSWMRTAAVAAAVLAVIVAVAALVVAPLLWLVAVALAGAAGFAYATDRRAAAGRTTDAEWARRNAESTVAQVTQRVHDGLELAERRRSKATSDHAAVVGALQPSAELSA